MLIERRVPDSNWIVYASFDTGGRGMVKRAVTTTGTEFSDLAFIESVVALGKQAGAWRNSRG